MSSALLLHKDKVLHVINIYIIIYIYILLYIIKKEKRKRAAMWMDIQYVRTVVRTYRTVMDTVWMMCTVART